MGDSCSNYLELLTPCPIGWTCENGNCVDPGGAGGTGGSGGSGGTGGSGGVVGIGETTGTGGTGAGCGDVWPDFLECEANCGDCSNYECTQLTTCLSTVCTDPSTADTCTCEQCMPDWIACRDDCFRVEWLDCLEARGIADCPVDCANPEATPACCAEATMSDYASCLEASRRQLELNAYAPMCSL